VAACAKPPVQGNRRVAILPFENLTGDASLDWVRAAGPAMLGEELAGSRTNPVVANSLVDARLENATDVLHTYYTKERGALLITAEVEDRRTRRIQPVAAAGATLLAEVGDLTRNLDPQARAFSTTNAAATEAWGRGDYEKAVALDPDFGTAWASLVKTLAESGKADQAIAAADQALARKSLRSDWSRGELRALVATLRNDYSARANALTDLANSTPRDLAALAAAAQAQTMARNFREAAELYRRLRVLSPANPAILNSLGYAEGFSGNVEAAAQIMQDYAKLPDSQVNAHDSLGEIYFMNGRFREAEQEFLKASSLDPHFLNGAPAVKAAYAHWLGGDLPGADAMIQKIVVPLAGNNASLAVWRQATWLYATGRQDQAIAILMRAQADPRLQRQLTLWQNVSRLPTDLDKLRAAYFSTPPGQDGVERVLYGASLVAAGKDGDARAILTRWPLPEASREPELESLIFPKYIELRKKLHLK